MEKNKMRLSVCLCRVKETFEVCGQDISAGQSGLRGRLVIFLLPYIPLDFFRYDSDKSNNRKTPSIYLTI